MVRTKNSPNNKPRVSSTPNVGTSEAAHPWDFSDFTSSVGSMSTISFPSLERLRIDYSRCVGLFFKIN